MNIDSFLRQLNPDDRDVERITVWLNDNLVNRFLEVRFNRPSKDEQKEQILKWNLDPDYLYLGIFGQSDGREPELIGTLKFGPYNRNHHTGELGLVIGDTNYWGLGIASRSIYQAERIIMKEFKGVRKITAGAYSENLGSLRAFSKNGFKVEGILENQVVDGLKRSSVVILGKLLDAK